MAIVTGDLTDFGAAEEYELFRSIMEPLPIPYRAILGNHDDVEEMRLGFFDQDWMPKSGPIDWTVEFEDLALIGLDTKVVGKAYGYLSDTSLDYLQHKLTALAIKPVVVATHHPPSLQASKRWIFKTCAPAENCKLFCQNIQVKCGWFVATYIAIS